VTEVTPTLSLAVPLTGTVLLVVENPLAGEVMPMLGLVVSDVIPIVSWLGVELPILLFLLDSATF
jgi:hypothetical protein